MSDIIINEQHSHAVELHQKIIISANLAQQNLWDMCTSLKQMRDSKLYKELGYANFEDYCENEIGFSRMNAYRYISIAENINPKNVTPGLQIGMKKLYLLSTISESEQQKITSNIDIENTTVKELKAEIDKLKAKNEEISKRSIAYCKKFNEAKRDADNSGESLRDITAKFNAEKDKNVELNNKVKELESRPLEIQSYNAADEQRRLNETIKSLEAENIKQNEALERQYREDEQAVRKMLENDKKQALENLKAELIQDKEQALLNLRDEYEQKLETVANTHSNNSQSDEKEIFKAYFTIAVDSFNRVLSFAKSADDKQFCISKIKNFISAVSAQTEV